MTAQDVAAWLIIVYAAGNLLLLLGGLAGHAVLWWMGRRR